ncbi:MAG TPA: hypothetical protein VMH27_18500 [Puia sp.]|nr:hypothetical protein [Puia sp.]
MVNKGPLSPKRKTILIYFLAGFFVFLLFPAFFYTLPVSGVDGSWEVAMHLATKYHLKWGEDFIYTYGPLAVLRLRYPVVLNKYVYLLSDIYYLSVLFIAFSGFIRQHFRPGPIFFLFCCVLIGIRWEMETWYQFLLLLFLIGYIAQPDKRIYLVHAAVLALLSFYIKVNSGLINIGLFGLVVHYALVVKKLAWKPYAVLLASFIAALFLSAWLLRTDLPAYIKATVHLLQDYENAMYMPLYGKLAKTAPLCAGLFLLVWFACYGFVLYKAATGKRWRSQLDTAVTYLLVAAGMFIWYKNGFVRADAHVFQFFEMAGPLVLFLYVFTSPDLGKKVVVAFCWTMLAIDALSLMVLPDSAFPGEMRSLVNFKLIATRVGNLGSYIKGLRDYDRTKARMDSLTSLPNAYKTAVGDHPADIIPIEIALLYSNGIRYAPRPVAQSYVAYDKYLDDLNYDRYMSSLAPDYVFFTLDGTNDRFEWMDEGRIKLALLAHYQPEGMVQDQLLLRKDTLRTMTKEKEDTLRTEMGKNIPVGKGPGMLFTRFIVRYNWRGKFRSLIYQPPALTMAYTLKDGEVRYVKALNPILEAGMVLNKYVNSTAEFQLFLLSDGQLNEDVDSVRLEPAERGYRPEITMINTWYAYGEKSKARLLQDSLELQRLTNGNMPLKPVLPSTFILCGDSIRGDSIRGDSIRYGLEYFRNHAGLIRLAGWAIRERHDNSDNTVRVLAKSAAGTYQLPTRSYATQGFPPDLLSRKDLDSSGFVSIVSTAALPPGEYRVGLAISNKKNDSTCIRYIDRYFDIQKP